MGAGRSLNINYQNNKTMKKILLALAVASMTACEKSFDEPASAGDPDANIVIHFDVDGVVMHTRAPVTDVCSRLNVAVFKDGQKIKNVAQKAEDSKFGTVGFSLAEGTYQMVAVAHNCNGSATITSTEKVTFPNNRVTDTFLLYCDISTDGSEAEESVTMKRVVSLIDFNIPTLPDGTNELMFYYTGGSSTLSPKTGLGCVNSRQTEYRDVSDDGVYQIYSFPHTVNDELTKLTITALDADGNTIDDVTFNGVPITKNKVTRFSQSIFGSIPSEGTGFVFECDDEWDGYIDF